MTTAELDVETVRELSRRMNVEETRAAAGLPFFRDLLDQTLRFRRASGAIVTREEFLIDLADPANGRERIETVGDVDCDVYENCAVVSVLLHVVGHNGPKSFDGLFRNIRIFHRTTPESPWLLKVWFNDAAPGT